MKKTLFAIAAMVAMVACNNDYVVKETAQEAIGFDNMFVDNSTRSKETPGYSSTNLFEDFAVYGFVEGAPLFNGVEVGKDVTNADLTSGWRYNGTQYWIAGANYDFYAVAPFDGGWSVKAGTATDAGAVISFTNENGTQDLLYSGIVERQGAGSGNVAVAFTFKHILSKVKFSFKNGYNASAATICVRDIQITNADKTAEATLTTGAAWDAHGGVAAIAFGNATTDEAYATDADDDNFANYDYAYDTTVESYYERFVIPANKEWEISFKVDLLVSGAVIKTYEHTAKLNAAFEPGASYDIAATITAANIDPNNEQEPIEFTATMTDWSEANNENATVDTIQQGTENN